MDDRKEDISVAHPQTCDWFFKTNQFQQWCLRDNIPSHNGVLWIKGHPGTGKSTLMKHTLTHFEETSSKTHIIAAHFFNARGDTSEQTLLSMLRSLLYQLLETEPAIYERFLRLFHKKWKNFEIKREWRESDLKNFLLSEIQHYQSKPLIVLVDALDECEESRVRDVVEFLEQLSIKAVSAGVTLNICLSSRYYPRIGIKKHLELVVEEPSEHNEDTIIYTRDNLTIRDNEIEKELLEKASGIFMWAVLVIKMLNKAYDEGQIKAMHRVLHDVPGDLEHVFEVLLIKDNPDKHETIFMLQFVLLARRPLKPEELYFAMLAETNAKKIDAWDRSRITLDDIRRRITNSSRGLIEVRKGEGDAAVQFIHKSVNDFLIRNQRLQRLSPALKVNPLGSSHERLRSCCMAYIMMEMFQSAKDRKRVKALEFSYPFLEYASTYVLEHAEEADRKNIGQANFLQRLLEEHDTFEKMRLFHNSFEKYTGTGCVRGVSLLHMLAFHGYNSLTKALLDKRTDINAQGGIYGYALQAAAFKNNKEIVELLLKEGADVNAQGGILGSALQAAAENKEIVELLLAKGADVNAQGGIVRSALQAAAGGGNKEVVELLLEKGADVNTQGGVYGNALQAAAMQDNKEIKGNKEILELLLKRGADVNTQGGVHGSAIQAAATQWDEDITKLLLKEGADINIQGGNSGSALQLAAACGSQRVFQLLLIRGADINAQGGIFGNALQAAVIEDKQSFIKMLLRAGVDVNAKEAGFYGSALQAAVAGGHKKTVKILLKRGADINAQGGIYGNALQAARAKGDEKIIEIFNDVLQAAVIPKTEAEVLEIMLKQRVNADRQRVLRFFLFKAFNEKTVEILLKETVETDNQWIYDLFYWRALEEEKPQKRE
ncbi:ankyrin repeat-containing domain protein [Trichoderma evansii]